VKNWVTVERDLKLLTRDGIGLEGVLAIPEGDVGCGLVLCHPHPEHGGTMNAPLLVALERAAVTAGIAVLRFNFRGVGRSEGVHAGGEAEVTDVDAAVAAAGEALGAAAPIAVGGWSFGADVALAWLSSQAHPDVRYVGIAPALRFGGSADLRRTGASAKLLVVGDRDQFVPVEKVRDLAACFDPPATVDVLEGCDHFFPGHFTTRVAETVVAFLAPGC
jgi:alpha/beta superfamily hydrolase